MSGPDDEARRAAEDAVRGSYGRLVAFLASMAGDVAQAEDALSEALVAALRVWPAQGVPERPTSWLVTAARRNLIDASRRRSVAARHLAELARLAGQEADEPEIPDRRLELMFACTHPAIDQAMHSPLILQAVLGLDAARIAPAFLVAPAAMGQRLVRVKTKIREAGVPLRVPDLADLPDRLGGVLDAIYAAYGSGWDSTGDPGSGGLVRESIRLARVLAELLPAEPEAHGLLALLLHSHARAGARRTADGTTFVALEDQDTARWDPGMIAEAERHLSLGYALRRLGPYQLQAAIQSVHNRRALTGTTDWAAVAQLYRGVLAFTPTIGAYVARAAAVARAESPGAALVLLDDLPAERVRGYQPYWATRAEVLRGTGDHAGAAHATRIAVGLTEDAATRRFLLARDR